MSTPLRAVVVGLGFGASVHVPALRGSSSNFEVIAISSRDPKRAARVASDLALGIPGVGIEEVLGLKPDLVTLAVPPRAAPELAATFLGRGVPLFYEKPVAADLSQARRLAMNSDGPPVAVDFEFAELAPFRALLQAVHSREVGDPLAADITWVTRSRVHESRHWTWKTDAQMGGGVVHLFGSHLFQLIERCFGEAVSVTAELDDRSTRGFAPQGRQPAPDGAQILLSTSRGVQVSVVLSNATVGTQEHRWVVRCTEGTLTLTNHTMQAASGFTLEVANSESRTRESLGTTSEDARIRGVTAILDRFGAAIRSGGNVYPDLATGIRVQSLIDAVFRSAAIRQPVEPEPI